MQEQQQQNSLKALGLCFGFKEIYAAISFF